MGRGALPQSSADQLVWWRAVLNRQFVLPPKGRACEASRAVAGRQAKGSAPRRLSTPSCFGTRRSCRRRAGSYGEYRETGRPPARPCIRATTGQRQGEPHTP